MLLHQSKHAIFWMHISSIKILGQSKFSIPSVQSSDGKPGVPKFYSFRDIVALRVIKTLLDNGGDIQRVRGLEIFN